MLGFLALVKKELLQLLKNPKSRMVVFTPPITQLLFLGYAATMDLKDVPFTFLDRANTYESRQLLSEFASCGVFSLKGECNDEADLRRRLDEKEAKLALVFPVDFARTSEIQVLVDGRNSFSAGIALSYVDDIVSRHAGRPLAVATRGYFNPEYDAQYFILPCLLAVLVLLALTLLVALTLAKEKEAGTYDQLRLTPYSPFVIMAAKGFSGALIGAVQVTLCLTAILLWFKVPYTGSPAALLLLLLCFIACAVGMGLAMAVLCSNLQQAMITVFMFSVPFVMLSGMATPIACMPSWLQAAMLFNPLRWCVEALQKLFLEGAGLSAVLPTCGVLLALAAATFSFAVWRFGRR